MVLPGLGLPQVTQCMYELKARGKDLYAGVLTVDEAGKEILNNIKKQIGS